MQGEENIQNFIEALGGKKVKFSATDVMFTCPLSPWTHGKGKMESRPSMGLNLKTFSWNCFACSSRGYGLEPLAQKVLGYKEGRYVPITEAIQFTQRYMGDFLLKRFESIPKFEEQPLGAKEVTPLPEAVLKCFKIGEDSELPYPSHLMLVRKLSLAVLAKFEVGYDEQERRATFPVRNDKKEFVGMVGKSLVGAEIPYKNYFEFHKSLCLFGIHHLGGCSIPEMLEKGSPLIIVEGILDVIRAHQYGYFNVVSLMGLRISPWQYNKIASLSEEVCLWLDSPVVDVQSARAYPGAVRTLQDKCFVTVPDFSKWGDSLNSWNPDGVKKDVCDLSFEEFYRRLNNRGILLRG